MTDSEPIAAPSQPMGLTLEQDLVVEAVLKHAPEIRTLLRGYGYPVVPNSVIESFVRSNRVLLVSIVTDLREVALKYPNLFERRTAMDPKQKLDEAGMPATLFPPEGPINWALIYSIYLFVLEHKDELTKAGQTVWEIVKKLYDALKN